VGWRIVGAFVLETRRLHNVLGLRVTVPVGGIGIVFPTRIVDIGVKIALWSGVKFYAVLACSIVEGPL